MHLKITTWNINSVRLRLDQVGRALDEIGPDILCLQETKCPDNCFPLEGLRAFGYPHIAQVGQKGYNGVAILSRFPFASVDPQAWCERSDARHIAVTLGPEAGKAAGFVVHNFYVPAGGDLPDPEINPKFAHKLQFLDEMRRWGRTREARPAILVGDLNVAPLEHDVWSHKQLLDVVSHTPIEIETLETLREEGGWIDGARRLTPEPTKIYTWWSYRSPNWAIANKGRRLDHAWLSSDLAGTLRSVDVHAATRSWTRPSDHVPVTASLEL
ncbi:exodeoxyribonuclease III [Enterovirga rhinocerotis]|uniref:Exodeoxyribonuclease-3 n=1 Tax=Enterovirga rhinocerotis TaxID=1339210 RepID=A0A4R7BMQ5_9HYPH|nr:exodeoxyribonuclease III [Enterovirga rhinocerotis]TDR85186.1 exodeoxyribonuclease-3 [Enterovirga rhinocerotis]